MQLVDILEQHMPTSYPYLLLFPHLNLYQLYYPPSNPLHSLGLLGKAQPSDTSFYCRYFLDTSQLCSLMVVDTPNPQMSAIVAMLELLNPELLSITV